MKMTIKKISVQVIVLSIFILPFLVHAEGPGGPSTSSGSNIGIDNPLDCGKTNNNDCTLMDLINTVLQKIIMPIAAVGVVIYIVYAGFTYVTAQGNPAKVSAAHQRLLWALVGAGILLGAVGISQVITNTVDKLIKP